MTPMSNPTQAYEALIRSLKEISLLNSTASVLHWDEQTQLPPRGGELRAQQASLLARMVHEQFTAPRIDEWLREVESSDLVRDPESDPAVNVRETRRKYDRARKLPATLVEEITKTAVLGQQAWAEARKKSQYALFRPWLAKMLDLKRQAAACYMQGSAGPARGDDAAYDALLEDYEPGETTANLRRVFESLRGPLVELIRDIANSGRKAPVEILQRSYPRDAQEKLARQASAAIGFDYEAGRLDVSVHPFCSGIGPGDTRMTTRYDEHWFGDAFFGVLHETGHGLYHQGLEPAHFGTPRGRYISLGIHESQSRLWENMVGRSRAFWQFFLPKARTAFPRTLAGVNDDQWYFAVNDIQPSLIRTESDEATYNLHILLRFELEQSLIRGQLSVDDVPAAWNEKMRQYLDLTPPDDAQGCLQDIHWSSGSFGYFPTYTLGNLYAAQFFEKAANDLGDLDGLLSRGDFSPLLQWLRQNIHHHGQRYKAPDLVKRVTGHPLTSDPLLRHLRRKAGELYGV